MNLPHFRLPLNLPHAATIAQRIAYHLDRVCSEQSLAPQERAQVTLQAQELAEVLAPYRLLEDNPPLTEAAPVIEQAAQQARKLVDHIERLKLGDDRLGQAVRNLFECLVLGEEGAQISLRAGENPDSALRPD